MEWDGHSTGVRKGVRHISQRLGTVTALQSKGTWLCSPKCWGWTGQHKCILCMLLGTFTPVVTEELTMEDFCWMFLIATHHKPEVLDSLHPRSQGWDSGVALNVVCGKWGLLTSRIKFCIPAGWQLTTFTWPIWSELILGPGRWVQHVQIGSGGLEPQRNFCSDSQCRIQVFIKVLRTKDFKQYQRQVGSWNNYIKRLAIIISFSSIFCNEKSTKQNFIY